MRNPSAKDGIAQRLRHMLLADDIAETLRSIAPGENGVFLPRFHGSVHALGLILHPDYEQTGQMVRTANRLFWARRHGLCVWLVCKMHSPLARKVAGKFRDFDLLANTRLIQLFEIRI